MQKRMQELEPPNTEQNSANHVTENSTTAADNTEDIQVDSVDISVENHNEASESTC